MISLSFHFHTWPCWLPWPTFKVRSIRGQSERFPQQVLIPFSNEARTWSGWTRSCTRYFGDLFAACQDWAESRCLHFWGCSLSEILRIVHGDNLPLNLHAHSSLDCFGPFSKSQESGRSNKVLSVCAWLLHSFMAVQGFNQQKFDTIFFFLNLYSLA